VPRSPRRSRPQARRSDPAAFSFGFGGYRKLLTLAFRPMRLMRRHRRPQKSGGPSLFELSLQVQRDNAHNPDSGLAILSRLRTSTLTAF
jgi:hypothetical protein